MAETAEVEKPVATVEDKAPASGAAAPSAAPVAFDFLFGNDKEVAQGLGEIKRREAGENERIMKQSEGQAAQDRSVAQRHYSAAGVEAEKMAPWNAQQEYEKVHTSPMEAFGSFASVFAVVASAFTHAPLENALNASAAAMSAIKKGDDDAYERGHSAWKENMDLVQKRFNMQNTLYKDALDLMTHDQNSGRIALQNAALRFGDQKTLFLLENGLDKDVIDLNTARIRQMEAMTKAADGMTDSTFRRNAFDALEAEKNPNKNPQQTVQNWNFVHGVREPYQQKLMEQYLINHQGDPPDVLEKGAAEYARSISLVGRGGGSPENQYMEKWRSDYIAKNGHAPSPDEEKAESGAWHEARRKTDLKTKGIEEIQKNSEAKGVPMTTAEASRQWNLDTQIKPYTSQEQRWIKAVPNLMNHLSLLDWMTDNKQLLVNDPTGIVKYLPGHLAAVYGGFNDPQQMYEVALRGAKGELGNLSSGGNQLKAGLTAQMDRLPGNFNDSRFNKRLTQSLMQDTASSATTLVSLLEKSGKALPKTVQEDYAKYSIYPDSMAKEAPLTLLRTNPQIMSQQQIEEVFRNRNTLRLTPDDRKKLDAELARREALERQPAGAQ